MNIDLNLYLVVCRELLYGRDLLDIVEKAIRGGITAVQLREKHCSAREYYEVALKLKPLCGKYNIPLIINDRLDIALAADTDGLHIGNKDIPVDVARKLLGNSKILGLSVESVSDAINAQSLDIDYIGISPVFETDTKTDTAPPLCISGLKSIVELSKIKTVAIGGINLGNAISVRETGVDGIAVASAILCADDPYIAAMNMR